MSEQGTVSCPSCGFAVPAGSQFCPKCGHRMITHATPVPMPVPYRTAPPFGESALPPRSAWAITSLICGIVFCIPLASLCAIIFGIIGIVETKDGRKRGMGMAITGLVLGLVLGIMIVPAMLISILLPSLNRARETANRIKCASDMRQIGQAILLYTNQYGPQYPPDLATLMKTESISPAVFVCPDSTDTPASGPGDLEAGGHDSYVYLGKGLTMPADPSVPILYEADSHHVDGANFLFGDGHVEFMPKAQEAGILSRVNKAGGQ
jgi:prepilin-type processing-associated H-X9-DG protein